MLWQLYIEEYSPDLRYIKGKLNKPADALSPLGILNAPMDEAHFTEALCSEYYALDEEELSEDAFPLSSALLGKVQSTDKAILVELKKTKSCYTINLLKAEAKPET
jgi:hypothetical protein